MTTVDRSRLAAEYAERYALDQGDTARFSGLSSHHYETEESTAVTHTVVGYPRD